MKQRTFVHSLNDAVDGFLYAVKHERNMRVHFLFAFLVLLSGILLGLNYSDWVILCSAISFVMAMEMVNTVVEEMADVIKSSVHPQVRIIKHISAGAVLISALNALIVGFLIFSKYWNWPLEFMAFKVRHADWHITFMALLVAVFLVIAGKAFFRRGTPFRGGAVSGHAAVAFALWTAVLFTQTNIFLVGVTFCLAALVAQSRLRAKIHSFREVVAGAVLGTLITALFFQIFR